MSTTQLPVKGHHTWCNIVACNMLHGIDKLSIPCSSLQYVAWNTSFNHTHLATCHTQHVACNNIPLCMVAFTE